MRRLRLNITSVLIVVPAGGYHLLILMNNLISLARVNHLYNLVLYCVMI